MRWTYAEVQAFPADLYQELLAWVSERAADILDLMEG